MHPGRAQLFFVVMYLLNHPCSQNSVNGTGEIKHDNRNSNHMRVQFQ